MKKLKKDLKAQGTCKLPQVKPLKGRSGTQKRQEMFLAQNSTSSSLTYDEIINGNIELHKSEAAFYDRIHYPIRNHAEQKRLRKTLGFAKLQIQSDDLSALDFGAGTGNVTEKLLTLGFHVVAVDLSEEMLAVLRMKNKQSLDSGRLKTLALNIDGATIKEQFDMVTSYSVLHHLPDYLRSLKELLRLVKLGGICYIDHERVPKEYVGSRNGLVKKIINFSYWLINFKFLLRLYNFGVKLPTLDHSKADVHEELDYPAIFQLFRREGFEIVSFAPYYANLTPFSTPLNILHHFVEKANYVLIIARRHIYE
jgi:2-polyprenyl-3-methyl-5-hydroxy-6-metoxy-1,4-benzoquinol methylase